MFRIMQYQLLFLTTLALCLTKTKQHSIVIIGAGPSGLAAATRLLEHNLTDVTVLEAEARIGGRVHNIAFGDAIIDLGAEWVDGQEGNAVYELVKDMNLLGELAPGLDILFSDGRALSRNHSEELLELFMGVSKTMDQIDDHNITTADALTQAYKTAVQKKYSNDPENLELSLKCLPLMEKYILSLDSSFSWHDSSASKNYRHCSGEHSQTWKGKGFSQIFDLMAKKIPNTNGINSLIDNVIHLKKTVSKIDYNGDKADVTCTDGVKYKADFVLFTPSLGVLKHDHEDLFHPALPEAKVSAIEDLGIDAVMKIVLYYEDIWWPSDIGGMGYNFVFTEEDEKEIATLFPDESQKNGKSWVTSLLGFLPNKDNPHVLFFWIVGPSIPSIEQMSDDKIKAGIEYVLTKFLSHKHLKVTKPDKMIKSSWYSNPHFRGSYSYETLRSYREKGECVHMILAEPLKNNAGKEMLLFAGEATHMTYYATVHGAVETGYREADRILQKISNN